MNDRARERPYFPLITITRSLSMRNSRVKYGFTMNNDDDDDDNDDDDDDDDDEERTTKILRVRKV